MAMRIKYPDVKFKSNDAVEICEYQWYNWKMREYHNHRFCKKRHSELSPSDAIRYEVWLWIFCYWWKPWEGIGQILLNKSDKPNPRVDNTEKAIKISFFFILTVSSYILTALTATTLIDSLLRKFF